MMDVYTSESFALIGKCVPVSFHDNMPGEIVKKFMEINKWDSLDSCN
jgi:hypothetical protein